MINTIHFNKMIVVHAKFELNPLTSVLNSAWPDRIHPKVFLKEKKPKQTVTNYPKQPLQQWKLLLSSRAEQET